MSIYSELLSVALDEPVPSDDEASTAEALAKVAACRSRLHVEETRSTQSDWTAGAIADQLAYDIALIELARLLGIEVDLGGFGRSLTERARIEQLLMARGLPIDQGNGFTRVERQKQKWGQR